MTRKALRQQGYVQRALLTEYHVVPNGKRWDVERDDMFTGFFYDMNAALGLAISATQRIRYGRM